jgi:hypothetical protein
MKKNVLSLLTLGVALVAAPVLAGPKSSSATKSAGDTTSGALRVTGTIVSLSAQHIDVKVESASTDASHESGTAIGKTESFKLNSMTDQPLDLKVGDHIDLWFTQAGNAHLATRIALATTMPSSTSGRDDQSAEPGSPPASAALNHSANRASNPAGQSSSTVATDHPATSKSTGEAATTSASKQHLPKTASELPLIGLIGLAALGVALMLRFAFKA